MAEKARTHIHWPDSFINTMDKPFKIGWAKLPGLPSGVVWPIEVISWNRESQSCTVYCESDDAELKVKMKNIVGPYGKDSYCIEKECIGILKKKNLKASLHCFKQDLDRIRGIYTALCEQNAFSDPVQSEVPSTTPDVSAVHSVDPVQSEVPSTTPDVSAVHSVDPVQSDVPSTTPDVSAVHSVDPVQSDVPSTTPDVSAVHSVDPVQSDVPSTTPDVSAVHSVDPVQSDVPSTTPDVSAVHSVDPVQSEVPSTTPDVSAVHSVDPVQSDVPSTTPDVSAVHSVDPVQSDVPSTTPDVSAVHSVDPVQSEVPSTTPDLSAVHSVDPVQLEVPSTTPDVSAVHSVDPVQSEVPSTTPDLSAVHSVDPVQSEVPSTTPDVSAVHSVDPVQSDVPSTTPDVSAVHSVDPVQSDVPSPTPDVSAVHSVDPVQSDVPSTTPDVSVVHSSYPSTSFASSTKLPRQNQPVITASTLCNHECEDMESDHESDLHEDSSSEYIPDSNLSDEEDSDASAEFPVYTNFPHLTMTNQITSEAEAVPSEEKISEHFTHRKEEQVNSISSSGSQLQSSTNSPECSIEVLGTTNDETRVYDKRHYCLYCEEPCSKLPRHLELKHKNEIEVGKLLAATDKIMRNKMLVKLRNLGNHRHNTEVIRNKSGTLVVSYRPSVATSWEAYAPCEFCLGYYVGSELWKHIKRCPLAPTDTGKHRKILQMAKLLLPTPTGMSFGLHQVLSSMKNDEVSRCCKGDALIKKLGEKLYLKHGHDFEQFPYIRNVLREISRLLIDLRKAVGPVDAELERFITPKLFRSVVLSARNVAGFSEDTHKFQTPSLALKLGHSLKKCSKIIKGEALQQGDEVKTKEANSFYELIEMNWTEEVSTHALRTLSENKRNKVKLIPLTEDVKLLSQYLREQGEMAFNSLHQTDNKMMWSQLNEAALAQVILFNRRRQGEVSKMKLEDFKGKHKANQEDVMGSLSSLEKKLCKTLERIEIVGKRGRIVPVILTTQVKKWIDFLLEKRENVGVHKDNEFVFARCYYGSLGHISGCAALRNSSEKCGAKQPTLLRSTKLRKQIGTLSQILNLKDHELDILANFLGHDIRVHREFYRLPEETIQVAKVSKLLLSLESGQIGEQKGKTLDEIEVDPEEDIFLEPDDGTVSDDSGDDDDPSEGEHNKTKSSGENGRSQPLDLHVDEDRPGPGDCSDGDWEPPDKKQKKQCPVKKIPWSEEAKDAVMRHFSTHVTWENPPERGNCEMSSTRAIAGQQDMEKH